MKRAVLVCDLMASGLVSPNCTAGLEALGVKRVYIIHYVPAVTGVSLAYSALETGLTGGAYAGTAKPGDARTEQDAVANVNRSEAEATMVMLGRHGRGYVVESLLGSVTHTIIRGSDIPVMVVPRDYMR